MTAGATLLIGALMGAVAAFLVYVGVVVVSLLRARHYGQISVTDLHGRVVLAFDSGADPSTLRRVTRSMIGGPGVVHYCFQPEDARRIATDVAVTADRLQRERCGRGTNEDEGDVAKKNEPSDRKGGEE